MISARLQLAVAGAGSAALLAGALGSQFIGGLAPCPLCITQRWPHVAAVVIAVLAISVLGRFKRALAGAGALAMLAGSGLGLYHTGIERGWWKGPDTCTSADITNLTTDDLMAQIMSAPLVRCDEVAWDFLSLSMASWNGIISLGLAGLWLAVALRPQTPRLNT
jgi:disulfide bond formation protein DsbB